ncbi:DUF3592 domain-containing protein [Sphingopyxis sp. KK2]|uniref:DUF3592 domain-containing protein n=1 Tax=Sphingopyxis sp. KK2 TaxID=1855727 RepID=UPI00097E6722|nr:DUF3592 domain-containing protein [Sphingopyxis sp. KK2]
MDEALILRIIPWFFAGIGLLFAGIGLSMARTEMRGRRWHEVEGRVIGHDSHWSTDSDGDRTLMHTATIEYRLAGVTKQMPDSLSTNRPKPVGSIMRVRYNPDDPNDVMVWAPLRNGCFIGMFVGLGSLFALVGGVWILVAGTY